MGLSSSGITGGQGAKSAQIMQFYNLLTGVMTDQPVTLKNTLTLGGSQAAVNGHLLNLQGVDGQSADYIRVYEYGNPVPIWSINSAGQQVYSGPLGLAALGSDPDAPASGLNLYAKGDDKLYVQTSGDVVAEIGLASALTTHEADTSTHGVGEIVGRTEIQTLTNKTLTAPTIADFTNATHNHSSDATGGTGVGEIEATATGTVGDAGITTTAITIPSCSKLLWLSVNGLIRSTATRTNATTVSYGYTAVAGDAVVCKYVATV